MRVNVLLLTVALLGLGAASCAAISGIDDFTKGGCSGGHCDAGSSFDVGVDAKKTSDALSDRSASGDTAMTPDGRSADEASTDALNDAPRDSLPDIFRRYDGAGDGGATRIHDGGDAARPDGAEAGCGPVNTIANCTACGLACDTSHSLMPACDGTECTYMGCAAGYADCVTTAPDTDGCETQVNTITNCSACDLACDALHSAGATCNGATCLYTGCAAGWGDCSTTAPDSDGCETELNTTTNCSACSVTCDTTHSLGTACNGTTCTYTGCMPGWGDCDKSGTDSDGCETPTDTVTNCNACNAACDSTHSAGAACTATGCTYTGCSPGFADCATTAPDLNGCETATNSITNCGGCNNACDTTHSLMPTCDGTTCQYAGCASGYADCNPAPPDTAGCSTAIGGTMSCGACGHTCDTIHSIGASCVGGTCEYTGCQAGYGDCNMTPPNTNGCETPLNTVTNCGMCGEACDTSRSKGAACNGTTCSYTGCDMGYADCNKTAPDTDGCESNLSSPTSCSACADSCNTANTTATPTCNGTTCSYVCENGFADCSTGAPNTGGCTTPTNTTNNCTGCGIECIPNNANSASCNGLTCSYMCQTGFQDCSTAAPNANGCECAGTACCPGGAAPAAPCQTAHSNGEGQTFYDCNLPKTYTSLTALAACVAYATSAAVGGTAANCADGWECQNASHQYVPPTEVCYQSSDGSTCIGPCWDYSSTKTPITNDDLQGDLSTCSCPGAPAGATWN